MEHYDNEEYSLHHEYSKSTIKADPDCVSLVMDYTQKLGFSLYLFVFDPYFL